MTVKESSPKKQATKTANKKTVHVRRKRLKSMRNKAIKGKVVKAIKGKVVKGKVVKEQFVFDTKPLPELSKKITGRIPDGMSQKAKVGMVGNSQNIRLPKNCRFDCKEVLIIKDGDNLIIKPVNIGQRQKLLDAINNFPDDLEFNRNQPSVQERDF